MKGRWGSDYVATSQSISESLWDRNASEEKSSSILCCPTPSPPWPRGQRGGIAMLTSHGWFSQLTASFTKHLNLHFLVCWVFCTVHLDRFEKMSEKVCVWTVVFVVMSAEHSLLLLLFLPLFKWLWMQTNCFSDNSQWAQILLLLFTNVFMKA